jgi:hypothetical protein
VPVSSTTLSASSGRTLEVRSSTTTGTALIWNTAGNANDTASVVFKVSSNFADGFAKSGIFSHRHGGDSRTNLVFATEDTTANVNVTTTNARMTITSAGNVGIGTAIPSTKLHMSSGTLTIDGNTATSIVTTGSVGIGTSSLCSTCTLQVNGHISARSIVLGNGTTASCSVGEVLTGVGVSSGIITSGACGSTGGIGDAILSATQTFSGANTFTGTVSISSVAMFGPEANATFTQNGGVTGHFMRSYDGATQSSGCLVTIAMNDMKWTDAGNNSDPGQMVFSSTTTAPFSGPLGVLMETCAPNSICKVATYGPVRVQHRQSAISPNNGFAPCTFSTRCLADNCTQSGQPNSTNGFYLSGNDTSGWAWVFLGLK